MNWYNIDNSYGMYVCLCVFVASASAKDDTTDPSKYNVPQYFAHNEFSYYDIDAQADKFRLQQPSKFDPLKPKK